MPLTIPAAPRIVSLERFAGAVREHRVRTLVRAMNIRATPPLMTETVIEPGFSYKHIRELDDGAASRRCLNPRLQYMQHVDIRISQCVRAEEDPAALTEQVLEALDMPQFTNRLYLFGSPRMCMYLQGQFDDRIGKQL